LALREYEFYHGAALTRLVSIAEAVYVARLDEVGSGCYALNQKIGALIKYATDRMTPWSFTFTAEHKQALSELRSRYDEVLVLLVCRDDGMVALSYDATMLLIGEGQGTASVSVARRPRQMYSVSGTFGSLPRKLGDAEYAKQLLAANK
jgi:hypothetical protein